MSVLFDITFEIVTPESAEHGDAESRGYIWEGATLRDAIGALFETRTSQCGGIQNIEANDSDLSRARWLTVYNGMEFLTGAHESRAIHFPENLTGSSRARLINLIRSEANA